MCSSGKNVLYKRLDILSLPGGGEQNDEADHQLAVPQQGDLPQVPYSN